MNRPLTSATARVAAAALLVTLASGAGGAAPRSEVWQADLRVQSFDVSSLKGTSTTARSGAQLSARITIYSDNDDDARAVRLEILLPIGVGVLRVSAGCRPSASAVTGLTARVTCELGDVPVRGLREVTVTTTGPGAGGQSRFAAFVTSDTPDPQPTNNYAERAAP